jgi:hypothetical protein
MLPYSLDNNLVFTYDGRPFDWSQGGKFACSYAKATRPANDFQTECHLTARLLKDEADLRGRTPRVFLSGGLDSHVLALTMMEAGIDPNPITFRFKHGLNDHEMCHVESFAKRHGLDVEYVDLDIAEFMNSSEAEQIALEARCEYFIMLPHMKLMDHVWETGGLPIVGNGDFYAYKIPSFKWRVTGEGPKFVWKYIEYEYMFTWLRHAITHGILGSFAFFQHTPEITLSMLNEPLIDDCVNGRLHGKMSTRSTKYEVYIKYWPEFERRPKYGGGEKIDALCKKMLEKMRKHKLPSFSNQQLIPVSDFKQMINYAPTTNH